MAGTGPLHASTLTQASQFCFLQLPTTKVWLGIKDAKQRDAAPFDQEMAAQVYEYYFRNYAVHFSSEAMSTAFATIPQVRPSSSSLIVGETMISDELTEDRLIVGCSRHER